MQCICDIHPPDKANFEARVRRSVKYPGYSFEKLSTGMEFNTIFFEKKTKGN